MSDRIQLKILLLVSLVLLVGCSQGEKQEEQPNKPQSTSHYPVTVPNFGRTEASGLWQEKTQKFDKAPDRVVANTRPAAELLLHLGLKDKIAGVGAVFGEPDLEVAKEFEELPSLGSEYISKEVALGVNPDLVYGRGGLFDNAEWGVGTVASLNELGIPTYVLESSVTGGTFESIYKDIEQLGAIFNVSAAATDFAAELKERQQALAVKLAEIKEEQDFALLFIIDPKEVAIYSAKDETFFGDIFKMLKLNNVYQETEGEISIETLIATDPEILIIPDWRTTDGVDPTKIKESLYANPKLSSLQAIKNQQIYAVDYNHMFGYGYESLTGMERLAKELYPE